MGFRMKITGGTEDIVFDERSITRVDFNSASSPDSNARATDFGITVKVWGKMLYKRGGKRSRRDPRTCTVVPGSVRTSGLLS